MEDTHTTVTGTAQPHSCSRTPRPWQTLFHSWGHVARSSLRQSEDRRELSAKGNTNYISNSMFSDFTIVSTISIAISVCYPWNTYFSHVMFPCSIYSWKLLETPTNFHNVTIPQAQIQQLFPIHALIFNDVTFLDWLRQRLHLRYSIDPKRTEGCQSKEPWSHGAYKFWWQGAWLRPSILFFYTTGTSHNANINISLCGTCIHHCLTPWCDETLHLLHFAQAVRLICCIDYSTITQKWPQAYSGTKTVTQGA